jgi:hypothetical protein
MNTMPKCGRLARRDRAAGSAVLPAADTAAAAPDRAAERRNFVSPSTRAARWCRRAELARIRVEHLAETEHGLRITLPVSKGDRAMKGAVVGIPYGQSELCPVRALRRWLDAAGITEGPLFRRIWATRLVVAMASPANRPDDDSCGMIDAACR